MRPKEFLSVSKEKGSRLSVLCTPLLRTAPLPSSTTLWMELIFHFPHYSHSSTTLFSKTLLIHKSTPRVSGNHFPSLSLIRPAVELTRAMGVSGLHEGFPILCLLGSSHLQLWRKSCSLQMLTGQSKELSE